MKKILVLMLVLGIASMATAGLTITGPSTVAPLGTVTMYVTADSGSVTLGETAYVWLDYASQYLGNIAGDALSSPAMTTNMSGGSLSLVDGYYLPDGFKLVAANDPPNPPLELLVGDWVSFDVTASGTTLGNSIIVDLLDANFNIIAGGASVLVIPEPMTLGLLGLGGLFLRRRK